MVHHRRQVFEKPLEELEVGGIEGSSALRIDLLRSALETLGIPSGEDNFGSFGACSSGRFQSNTGAPANHDHSLPNEFRFVLKVRRRISGAHDSSLIAFFMGHGMHRKYP
jgi:hypothetical protein